MSDPRQAPNLLLLVVILAEVAVLFRMPSMNIVAKAQKRLNGMLALQLLQEEQPYKKWCQSRCSCSGQSTELQLHSHVRAF